MEKNFNTDNFEQMLREATDDFRMYPSRRVWHGIYNDLHPAKKWPSFAILLLLVTSIMYIGVTNPDKGGQPLAQVSSNQNEKATQPALAENHIEATKTGTPLTASPTRSLNAESEEEIVSNPNRPATQPGLYVASKQNRSASTNRDNASTRPQMSFVKANDIVAYQQNQSKASFKTDLSKPTEKRNESTFTTGDIRSDESTTTSSVVLNSDSELKANSISPEGANELSIAKPAVMLSKTNMLTATTLASNKDESGWMEDFAFRNLKLGDKWKGRMSYQVYVTPSMGYRKLTKNTEHSLPPTNALVANPNAPAGNDQPLNHSSAINLEIGTGIIYTASKILRLRAGVQINYTNYSINAQELNHPTFTSLMLTNTFTNGPVLSTRTTTIANTSGTASRFLNNNTYQVSIPVGADLKIAGNDKLKVYLGGTLQPTYILGGQSYLISADMKNYVADESFMRKHNLNGAVEAFVTYKTKSGVTLNVGPQFRYQFFSTYNKMYTYDEKLYNLGVKLGMTKNF